MKKCKSCQKEIDAKAKKCPYCQTDQRNWFLRHPIITILLVLVIFGIIGASGGDQKSSSSTSSSNTKEGSSAGDQEPPAVVAEEVDATEFIGAFDKNQLAAEKQYKDKRVKITAYIQNISEDIVGNPYLSLKPSAEKAYFGTTAKCTFGSADELTALENEQQIIVEGTVEEQSLGIIGLKDCKISN